MRQRQMGNVVIHDDVAIALPDIVARVAYGTQAPVE